jgi:hypothetical protein
MGIVRCRYLLRPQDFAERTVVAKIETSWNCGKHASSETSHMNRNSQKSGTVFVLRRLGPFKNRTTFIRVYEKVYLMSMTKTL